MANKSELVGKISTWQAVKTGLKAAVQMRFSGAYGGSYGGNYQLLDENFTRNVVRRALSYFAGSSLDFAQEAGDPTLSSLVMTAVNWLGRTMPEPRLVVAETDKEGKETLIPDHPAVALLNRPNPFYPGAILWKAFAASWITNGNVYWLKARNARGQVIQLWNVPPLWHSLSAGMTPRWPIDGTEFISSYEYQVDQYRYQFPPADVVHFRNGLDVTQRMGVPLIEPVYREIFKDNEESNFGALLAKNGAIPPVVLSLKESTITDEADLKAYKAQYQASTQGDNRGQAFVSNQEVEVTKLGFTPDEMDLRSAHRFNEERFAAVIGVPAIVLGFGAGLESSTYNNTEQADERAVENFLVPLWRYCEAELTHQLGPDFGLKPNQRFKFDLRDVRALGDDEDLLYKRLTIAFKGDWIKRSEARTKAGFTAGPEDEVYFSQASAKSAPPQTDPTQPPDGNGPTSGNATASKSYNFNGLTLARKPTEAEAAQIPAIMKSQDAARVAIAAILGDIRARLIADGLAALNTGTAPESLALAAVEQERIALNSAITAAYNAGQATVAETKSIKALPEVLRRVLSALLAAFGARVVARIIDEYSRAILRGLSPQDAVEQARLELDKEPAAYVDELASGAAYESVGGGRNDALVGEMGPGIRFIYSAILDKNTCKICKEDDLKEADDPRQLPPAPNPRCEGKWRCRCQIVIIYPGG